MLKEVRPFYRRLEAADREWHRQLARRFLWRVLAALPLLLLLAFILDIALHLAAGWRLGLDLAGLLLVGGLLVRAGYLAFVARREAAVIARHVETTHGHYGSALINSLQLADQIERGSISGPRKELAARALADYDRRLGDEHFEQTLQLTGMRSSVRLAAASVAVLLATMIGFHTIARTELLRYADPYGDHPPFSLTAIEIVEPTEGMRVIYGEGLVVKASTSGHTPDELFLSFCDPSAPEAVTTLPMFNKGKLGFYQRIETIKSPIRLQVHTRNHRAVSRQREVGIILTPNVTEGFATVAPPPYTCMESRESPYDFRGLKALVGSEVSIRLRSNRPLAAGTLRLSGTDGEQTISMTPVAAHDVRATFVAESSCRLQVSVTDIDGYESEQVRSGALTVIHDMPPNVAILKPDRDSFVTEDFKLELRVDASDDLGVALLRVHRALNNRYSAPRVYTYDECRRSVSEVIEMDLESLGVEPGDTISVFAETLDTRPEEPQLAATRILTLVVVSVEEYNAFLRQRVEIGMLAEKYGALVRQLEELAQEQERLNQEVAELQRQLAEGKPENREALTDELAARLADQQELNRKIDKLSEEMAEFGRDQPLYDIENSFQELVEAQASALRESIAVNTQELESFSQAMDEAGQGREGLEEALSTLWKDGERQKEVLAGSRKRLDEDLVQTARELGKLNKLVRDFNQFRMCYLEQSAIATITRVYDVRRELSQTDTLALRRQASREKAVADSLRLVESNLRKHADDAAATFPRAAEGARELADAIMEGRFPQLATAASTTMLIPDGPASYRQAEHLRQQMENLFGESGNCLRQCESGLDSYLRLLMGMRPGSTFQQMASGISAGDGYGFGFATGTASGSGDSPATFGIHEPTVGVLGNESLPMDGSATENGDKRGDGLGRGLPTGADGPSPPIEKPAPVDDPSRHAERAVPVDVDATVLDYEALIERYFQTIIDAENSP